jgi:ABC-type Zn uptake system ZnuABC Zn-binding protein ZnuA
VLVGCLAGGVILASDVYHSGSNVEQLLFGSLLLVDAADIRLAVAATAAVLLANVLFGRRWLATGFDEVGTPASSDSRLDIVLLGLIAFATTAALSVIGALLVAALFVAPAATVRLFANRMASWQTATVLLAAAEGTAGLWLSVKTNAPPGATIGTLSGAVFGLAAMVRAVGPRRLGLAVAGAVAIALLAAGCGSSGSDSGKVTAVATTTQIGDFVRQVGGQDVDVHQILAPNTDPHDYEPRPDDVTTTADAKIVFTNGDNLDAWMGKVVDDSGSDAKVVELGAGVPVKLPGESSGPEGSRYDPHWWHDPRNAEAAVQEIATELSAVDPDHKATFERNASAYERKLRTLDSGISRCLDSVPATYRKLVTDHDAFNYFASRYGIHVAGAVIPSQTTQAQPNAQDLTNLADLIKKEGVKEIFPESSLSPKLAQTLAAQTGATADHTLYGDTLGPQGSSGDTYLKMETANMDAMLGGFSAAQTEAESHGAVAGGASCAVDLGS